MMDQLDFHYHMLQRRIKAIELKRKLTPGRKK